MAHCHLDCANVVMTLKIDFTRNETHCLVLVEIQHTLRCLVEILMRKVMSLGFNRASALTDCPVEQWE